MIITSNKQELAEFVGILLGDGCLSLRENNPKTNNRLQISLNSQDDFEYIQYIKTLIKRIFGIDPFIKFRKKENTADILIFKKEIITTLIEVGLKLSPKWKTAIIPSSLLKDSLDLFVLRGYFDTDGCLVTTNNNGTIYPRLEMKICPSPMQNQFITILKKYQFRFGVYNIGKGEVRIQLNGKNELKKWLDLIGFSNQKHIAKLKRFI